MERYEAPEVTTDLKVATTAVVLDIMIEDGFIERDFSPQSPVQAIRDISHDPTLREVLCRPRWRRIRSLATSSRGGPRVLGSLERDPTELDREVDWVITRQWIEGYTTRAHLSWRDPRVSLMDLQYHDIRPDRASTMTGPARHGGPDGRAGQARAADHARASAASSSVMRT
jgi:pup-ligase protein